MKSQVTFSRSDKKRRTRALARAALAARSSSDMVGHAFALSRLVAVSAWRAVISSRDSSTLEKLWKPLQKKHILKHKECLPAVDPTRYGYGNTVMTDTKLLCERGPLVEK
jgi:hypothetical protein